MTNEEFNDALKRMSEECRIRREREHRIVVFGFGFLIGSALMGFVALAQQIWRA